METPRPVAQQIRPRARLPRRTSRGRSDAGTPVVFTAVDGTLLEAVTLHPGASRAMVRRLQACGVPVIPVTAMTLEEIEPIARELGLRDAMIIEAGGAIARWTEERWEVEPCGPSADLFLDVVREIEDRSGADLLVYSALPEAEAARLSGRSGERLQRSTRRCFSEPFIIETGDPADVINAAAAIGFSVRRGGPFLHLCRASDEGEAFTRLREELRCDVAIAIGSSPLHADFLSRAEIPIIVPQPNGQADPELLAKVPHARIARAGGPAGWAAAVDEVWPVQKRARSR